MSFKNPDRLKKKKPTVRKNQNKAMTPRENTETTKPKKK